MNPSRIFRGTQRILKIVMIITGLSTGGAEKMLLNLVERLDRKLFQPHVISLTDKGEIGPSIEASGVIVEVLSMKPARPNFFKFMRLVCRLRELKPDVVHTWMYHSDLMGGLAARFAGIRALCWGLHNSDLSPRRSKRNTRWVMRVCALLSVFLPKRVISCSEHGSRIHVQAGYKADRMAVIPNGFDTRRFAPDVGARSQVREELRLSRETPLVGLIGRFDSQKNHLGFILAATSIRQARPDVHYLLAGTNVDHNNPVLNNALARAGLSDRAHLLGLRDDIPHLMAALDVLALSSFGEAFPNVLGEAMACGVPCVVTDAGDAAEIVGDTGRVVASDDMEELAHQIMELLALPVKQRRALGKAARQRVQDRYELGKVVQQYQRFYQNLANES